MRETSFDHVEGNTHATYFSSERRWVNRFRKDAEKYPDDVKIIAENEDGSLLVHYPHDWVQMPRPRIKRKPMSDELRRAAAQRLADYRESQKS